MKLTYFNENKTEGKYEYENGNMYIGEFKNDKFHGKGELIYKNKGTYKGRWEEGKLIEGNFFFEDGLKYEDNWRYLIKDSFYYNEKINNNEIIYSEKKENIYLSNIFDVGDGFCNCNEKMVYGFDKKEEIRKINDREKKWVENHCADYKLFLR